MLHQPYNQPIAMALLSQLLQPPHPTMLLNKTHMVHHRLQLFKIHMAPHKHQLLQHPHIVHRNNPIMELHNKTHMARLRLQCRHPMLHHNKTPMVLLKHLLNQSTVLLLPQLQLSQSMEQETFLRIMNQNQYKTLMEHLHMKPLLNQHLQLFSQPMKYLYLFKTPMGLLLSNLMKHQLWILM